MTSKRDLLIFWIFVFGLIMKVGYRQICSRRMARNANFFFLAVHVRGIVAAPFLTVLPTDSEDCVAWSMKMNLPHGWSIRI
jgi:hypothetical protein